MAIQSFKSKIEYSSSYFVLSLQGIRKRSVVCNICNKLICNNFNAKVPDFERHKSYILLKSPFPSPHYRLPSPIQELSATFLEQKGVQLFIKRDDLIHPEISGNKWRKLQLNLVEAIGQHASALLTFGGAFSNHILAVAAAGHHLELTTIGIIRGEATSSKNATLNRAMKLGMQLHFINRSDYRNKEKLLTQLKLPPNVFIIPEGGTNLLGAQGCMSIIEEIQEQFEVLPDHVCCSVGTGGTIAGLILGAQGRIQVTGFSSLKGDFLSKEVLQLVQDIKPETLWNGGINHDYHFGGYAKWTPTLIEFINNFKQDYGIPLDPIYTGKMMFGIFDLIKKDYFPSGSRILATHTGGLQGIKGFNHRFGEILQ